MKMTAEHYAELQRIFVKALQDETVTPSDTPKGVFERLMQQCKHRSPGVKDVERASYWHVYNCALRTPNKYSDAWTGGQTGFRGVLYGYLNDDHIDTALRRIIREVRA